MPGNDKELYVPQQPHYSELSKRALQKLNDMGIDGHLGDEALSNISDRFDIEKVSIDLHDVQRLYPEDPNPIIRLLDLAAAGADKAFAPKKDVLALRTDDGAGGKKEFMYFPDTVEGRKLLVECLIDLSLLTAEFDHDNALVDAQVKPILKQELETISGLQIHAGAELSQTIQDSDLNAPKRHQLRKEKRTVKAERRETSRENDTHENLNKQTANLAHEKVEEALLQVNDLELNLLIAQAESITASTRTAKTALQKGQVDPWGTEVSELKLDNRVKTFYVLAGLITKFEEFESQNTWNSDVKLKMQSEIYELAKSIGIDVARDRDIGVKDVVLPWKWPKLTFTMLGKALFDDAKWGNTVKQVVHVYKAERTSEIDTPTALGMTQAIIRGDMPYQKNLSFKKMIKEYNKTGAVVDKKYNLTYQQGPDGHPIVLKRYKSADGKITYTNMDDTPYFRAADIEGTDRNVLNGWLAQHKDVPERMKGITVNTVVDQQGHEIPKISYELSKIDDSLLLELYHQAKGKVEGGKEVANTVHLKNFQLELLKRVMVQPAKLDRYITALGGEGTETRVGLLLGRDEFKELMGTLVFTPDIQAAMNIEYNHRLQKAKEAGAVIDEATHLQFKQALFSKYITSKFAELAQSSEDYKDRAANDYGTTRAFVGSFSVVEMNDMLNTVCTAPPLDKPADPLTAITEKGLGGEGGAFDQLTHAAYRKHPALGKAVGGLMEVAKVAMHGAEIGTAVAAGWNAVKTVWHTMGGLIDVVFNGKPFDATTFENASKSFTSTLKWGAIHVGVDLANDPSQYGEVIKTLKEVGGALGVNDTWKEETEQRKQLGRETIQVEEDADAHSYFKAALTGKSVKELMDKQIIAFGGDGKAKVDITSLLDGPTSSPALEVIKHSPNKQKYIDMANKDFARQIEAIGLNGAILTEIIAREPSITMDMIIERRDIRIKTIDKVLSDKLGDKNGVMTKETQNRLYFLSENDWIEKKKHLAFCIQQMEKLTDPSAVTRYINGVPGSASGSSQFVVDGADIARIPEGPKTISDMHGKTAFVYLKEKVLRNITEAGVAPGSTLNIDTHVDKYFKVLAVVFSGEKRWSRGAALEKAVTTTAGAPAVVKRRNYDPNTMKDSVSGYFHNNDEALFPSNIGSTHAFGSAALGAVSTDDNMSIATKSRDAI